MPLVFEGEVPDNVCTGHGLPQQEERGVQQLQAQGKQAAEESLICCSFFPSPFPFWYGKLECLIFQSDPALDA